jgi:hypothetical protein
MLRLWAIGIYWESRRHEMQSMNTRSFTVIVHKEEDMYIAECPEVGTVDQGETIEAAIAGLKEATRLYLEVTST